MKKTTFKQCAAGDVFEHQGQALIKTTKPNTAVNLNSGAVLFNKERSHIETINDMDGDVVNFFDWVKRDPERLANVVWKTPYSRKEYDRSFQKPKDDFQRALLFCIRLNMGHGFRTSGGKVGWKMDVQGRERAYALRDWNQFPERIIVDYSQ